MPQHSSSTQKSARKTKKQPLHIKTNTKRASTIFDLIKKDHREIEKLCKKVLTEEDNEPTRAQQTFTDLKTMVLNHDRAEESIFYNRVLKASAEKNDKRGHQRVLKSFEEHRIAGMLINEMSQIGPEDERFGAKMKLLSEILLHHVKQEELYTFKVARRVLNTKDRAELGMKFLREKKKILRH